MIYKKDLMQRRESIALLMTVLSLTWCTKYSNKKVIQTVEYSRVQTATTIKRILKTLQLNNEQTENDNVCMAAFSVFINI